MNIAEIIKKLLKKNNMTQADICRLTGIPTSLMSNYIKGKKTPSLSNSVKLAQAFNISMDELAGIDNKIKNNKYEFSKELLEVAIAYEKADFKTKNHIRIILDLPKIGAEKDTK
ncbi:MAG: helix-turn-helix domain-containing protein [Clostridia bacterium]|jgi:transcriptional regulator with XRE-family HTH domain|nr:helix-turn-helix domain-containing protein [Clostridia bacterium]